MVRLKIRWGGKGIVHKDINPGNILVNLESGDVKIIDFGISSRVELHTHHLGNPARLEGTLAYISPEQTGRMNRVGDYRTDFYSLGATFYEMLTGTLPFPSADPMDLVHSHIARIPEPVHKVRAELPEVVGSIVGAVSINLISEMLRPLEIYKWIVIPLILILVMIFRPTGLIAFREFDVKKILKPKS